MPSQLRIALNKLYPIKYINIKKHITGERFGKIVIKELTDKVFVGSHLRKSIKSRDLYEFIKEHTWKCQCDCGNIFNVKGSYLFIKRSKINLENLDCGCSIIARFIAKKIGINPINIPLEMINHVQKIKKLDESMQRLKIAIKQKEDFPMMRSERELIEWRKALKGLYSY